LKSGISKRIIESDGPETSFAKYFHLLTKEDTTILFEKLDEFYELIFFLDLHNKKLRKKLISKKSQKGGASHRFETEPADLEGSISGPMTGRSKDLEGSTYLLTEAGD
jgi:hypothetical protein